VIVARNLTDTITILTLTVGARSGPLNNPTQTWTATATEAGLFQQQTSTETVDNRDVVTSRGLLFGIPGSALTATSRVQLASLPGATFRVIGDPVALNSLGGRPSHTESQLELVK
jgi:hypothetical protein